jgi:hypothetical protein
MSSAYQDSQQGNAIDYSFNKYLRSPYCSRNALVNKQDRKDSLPPGNLVSSKRDGIFNQELKDVPRINFQQDEITLKCEKNKG